MPSPIVRRAGWLSLPLALVLTGCGAQVQVTGPTGSTTSATSGTNGTSGPTSAPTTGDSPTTSGSPTSTSGQLPSASQIVQQVQTRLGKAKSAHVVADHTENGTKQSIDIAGTVDGKNQAAKFGLEPGGIQAQFRMVDARVYVNGNAAYYRRSGATTSRANQLAGRWVSVPAARVSQFTDDLTINALLSDLRDNFDSSVVAGLSVSPGAQNGQPIWKLSDPKTSIVVLADGSGTLVSASHTSSSGEQENYVFDQWDSVPVVQTPANPITT